MAELKAAILRSFIAMENRFNPDAGPLAVVFDAAPYGISAKDLGEPETRGEATVWHTACGDLIKDRRGFSLK